MCSQPGRPARARLPGQEASARQLPARRLAGKGRGLERQPSRTVVVGGELRASIERGHRDGLASLRQVRLQHAAGEWLHRRVRLSTPSKPISSVGNSAPLAGVRKVVECWVEWVGPEIGLEVVAC